MRILNLMTAPGYFFRKVSGMRLPDADSGNTLFSCGVDTPGYTHLSADDGNG